MPKNAQFYAHTKLFLPSVLTPLSSVKQGVKYEYTIQVEAEGLLSDPSPPLLYTHGQSYCGDGLIQGCVQSGGQSHIYKGESIDNGGDDDDDVVSAGQRSVMMVTCWTGMAALRNATRKLTSIVMVSIVHITAEGNKPRALCGFFFFSKQSQHFL